MMSSGRAAAFLFRYHPAAAPTFPPSAPPHLPPTPCDRSSVQRGITSWRYYPAQRAATYHYPPIPPTRNLFQGSSRIIPLDKPQSHTHQARRCSPRSATRGTRSYRALFSSKTGNFGDAMSTFFASQNVQSFEHFCSVD
jgi:hypothetical protein